MTKKRSRLSVNVRSMLVGAWWMVAAISFVLGLTLAIYHYKVRLLDGNFDIGTVMFFGAIVMFILALLLFGTGE